MSYVREHLRLWARGPRVSAFLKRRGIDARRYWLLVDLFGELSDRGEMLSELGWNGVALKTVAMIAAGLSVLGTLVLVATGVDSVRILAVSLIATAYFLFMVLLSEVENSLLNPAEALVLAHQPVNGATYAAAKLSHLAFVVLYIIPAVNIAPALAPLLRGTSPLYPLLHLVAAITLGFAIALLCCGVYGWLIRFVPARRLKAAGELLSTLSMLSFAMWQSIRGLFSTLGFHIRLPESLAVRWSLGAALAAIVFAFAICGVRELSASHVLRISSGMHRPSNGRAPRRILAAIVAAVYRCQPARAGFEFVSRLAVRDDQFRRQALPGFLALALGIVALAANGWPTSPFSGRFTPMHILPHAIGLGLLLTCGLLAYGSAYKSVWFFHSVPGDALRGLSRGVFAALWVRAVMLPHVLVLLFCAWAWGAVAAGLFTAYSLAVSSVYLALELRLVQAIPFSRQVNPARNMELFPLVVGAGVAAASAVALQYLVIFTSAITVLLATGALAVAAYALTRTSLAALEASMRHSLSVLGAETGPFYTEVNQ